MKLYVWIILFFIPPALLAQGSGEGPEPESSNVIPYPFVRESDIMWSKTIWRVIDLREKLNHPLFYPSEDLPHLLPLIKVIRNGIQNGKITQVFEYDVFTNEPARALPVSEALTKFTELIAVRDSVGEVVYNDEGFAVEVADTLTYDRIAQYWIKESWFFDKARSVMEVRILYLAPVITISDPEQGRFAYKPLFWLAYPDCRNYFSQYDAYNPWNDHGRISYEDLFAKRIFGSYIRQESNVYGRPISSYALGMEAMLESEKIQEKILRYEEDLWHR